MSGADPGIFKGGGPTLSKKFHPNLFFSLHNSKSKKKKNKTKKNKKNIKQKKKKKNLKKKQKKKINLKKKQKTQEAQGQHHSPESYWLIFRL
jgi:hypothetical protein